MKEVVVDANLIAYCGLYCGSCRSYVNGKCPGCHDNVKATWCKVRKCCIEHEYKSCADCSEISHRDCSKLTNFISKIFAFIFKSDRPGCIDFIKAKGYEAFAKEMAAKKDMSVKK